MYWVRVTSMLFYSDNLPTSETVEWMEMHRWSFQGHLCADIQQFSPLNIVNVPSPSPSYQGRVFRALFPFLCVIAFLILGSSNTLLNPNTPIPALNTDLIDPPWNAYIRRLKMTTPTQFSLSTYQSSILLCVCISSRAMGPWLGPMDATPIQLVNSNRTLCYSPCVCLGTEGSSWLVEEEFQIPHWFQRAEVLCTAARLVLLLFLFNTHRHLH